MVKQVILFRQSFVLLGSGVVQFLEIVSLALSSLGLLKT